MFKNYLKIAFRNIKKHKAYSFINITGLAFGMACCLLILFWVQDELSFNNFFKNSDQIYRINKKYQMGNEVSYNSSTPYPLAQAAKDKYAEIIDATKFFRTSALIKYEDKIFNERRVCVTDSCFFEIFTFKFIKGDHQKALAQPTSMVITEAIAQKYFGDHDPIGKVVTLDNRNDFTITGVIQDIPSNSDIEFDIFVSTAKMVNPNFYEEWGSHSLHTHVLLQQETAVKNLEQKLSEMIQERLPEEKISLTLQPLSDIHLYSIDGKKAGMSYVYLFSVIAIFILTIACINFINLSTARSEKRAKEVGLRKVVGANRLQIIRQFFGESIIFTLIALAAALLLVEFFQSPFNNVTGKNLNITAFNSSFIIGLMLIAIFTGLVAGSYPALFLSSFQPITALKGTISQRFKNKFFRKILVIIQFSLSIMLLIGTGIIYNQLQYMQKKDLGFNKENVLYLGMNRTLRENYDAFKNELLQNRDIVGTTRTSELPTEIWSIMRGIKWEGKESSEGAAFGFAAIDQDYIETMNMEIVQGRNFSIKFPSDTSNFIFNEKAINVMGMADPIGKPFVLDEDARGTIVGVVKDFHFLPLTNAMEPLILMIQPGFYREVLVKIRSDNMKKTIRHIENAWKKISPDYPFEYHFLDERFEANYRDELRAGKIFQYFVIIAIFISCLGLLGLASFTAEQKTKEIGVRKVLGASIPRIVFLLIKEFTKWVILSNLIAWPIAYFAMNSWLQNFAYRVNIGILTFILSAIVALVIAVMTVSYQSIKAALANPVESLQYE